MKQNSESQISELNIVKPLPQKLQIDFAQDFEVDEEDGGATFSYLLPPCSPKVQAEKASKTILSIGHLKHNFDAFAMHKEQLEETSFELKESSTDFVFMMPSIIAGRSDEAISRMKEMNRAYDSRVMNIQGCGTNHYTQTFTPHSRGMGTQKAAPQMRTQGTQLHTYDFLPGPEVKKSIGTMLTMEKIVLQNTLSGDQKANLMQEHTSAWGTSKVDDFDLEEKSDAPEEAELKPRLEAAWTHSCKDTAGFPVNEITWNSLNQELLAAAYGETKFGNRGSGRIALWTLKNPAYPEKLVKTCSSCTCIQFSPITPYLLAAGFFDGTIQIFDIRTPIPKRTMNTADIGRHQQPVWRIAWVSEKEDDFRKSDLQHLLSIGGDGLIKQWTLREGVVTGCEDSMKLKRVANQARLKGSSHLDHVSNFQDGIGTALMTSPTDSNIYYVATDDGLVHKCSVSYKEQVLKSFFGHFRRIHQLKISPFSPEYFMTCGEDWTINLWSTQSEQALVKLEPGTSSVKDCDWCPFNSCVIGACLHNGTILVWDLSKNQKDATITFSAPNTQLASIQFSPTSPRIYVGDSIGRILCFHLKDIDYLPPEDANTEKKSLAKLQSCVLKN